MYAPVSTYRLQLHGGFTFADATGVLEYLHSLGVSACYLSPIFKARRGSTHGYDVADYGVLNPELGGEAAFDVFSETLHRLGMGLLLDVVPNHMGIRDPGNRWWSDVLEHGSSSAYASFFDIDWHAEDLEIQGKVLLPILEDEYRPVLESGKIEVAFEEGAFVLRYHEARLPFSPEALKILREKFHGKASEVRSYEDLHSLLELQNYRLASWRTGARKVNYRRFFDVNDLAAVRVELPEVFRQSHELVLRLLATGKADGLRVDHPDGLWDPGGYFRALQAAHGSPLYVVAEKILSHGERLPEDWPVAGTTGYDFLSALNGLFVKAASEPAFDRLYRAFTGEDVCFSDLVTSSKREVLEGSFSSELDSLSRRLAAIPLPVSKKKPDLHELRGALVEIAVAFPVYRTYTGSATSQVAASDRETITSALSVAKAQCPELAEVVDSIGRLLLLCDAEGPSGEEESPQREFILRFQQLTGPVMAKGLEDTTFYRYNRLVSLNEVGGHPDRFGVSVAEFHAQNCERMSRCPASLLASATHDTKRGEDARARLNVLSEIPGEWEEGLTRWKRFNDKLKVLVGGTPAPVPNHELLLYQALLGSWPGGLGSGPDSHEERTRFRDRIAAYMLKAVRESKTETSWNEPNADYEGALGTFIERLFEDPKSRFLEDFSRLAQRVAFFGRYNSLSQVLLKLASPGVPDLYQGTELWDLSLVDPDNRRPVNYARSRALLDELKDGFGESGSRARVSEFVRELTRESGSGRIKLHVIHRALTFRREHPALLGEGDYRPVVVRGEKEEHACSFLRKRGAELVLVVVPRLPVGLTHGSERPPVGVDLWGDTRLDLDEENAGHSFRNVLTGETLSMKEGDGKPGLLVGEALREFPVALLERCQPR
jgi:(1->4)-alpha-D-glucan 1-alpha-D-glucosylmutase